MTLSPGKPLVIALEEHYRDVGVAAAEEARGIAARPGSVGERLLDLDDRRMREMDEAGIDIQVISHAPSVLQQLDAEMSVELAARANDNLKAAIDRHPDRYGGFAALPTPDPQAAAGELERAVTDLGFKGAMIHGNTRGVFHDDKRFWPIYERAERLDVPIYLHPGPPPQAVIDTYYGDYLPQFPGLASAAWGYTIDTANQAMRLILSGVFQEHPNLKVIVGHLGEGLPFLLDRMDEALTRPGNDSLQFKKTFCDHFYVTTSGFFSTPALLCTILQMGIDRVLFSVDWPFVENAPGMKWMETVPLSAEDREKMFNLNARRLLKIP